MMALLRNTGFVGLGCHRVTGIINNFDFVKTSPDDGQDLSEAK